jgi:hypothetical protein
MGVHNSLSPSYIPLSAERLRLCANLTSLFVTKPLNQLPRKIPSSHWLGPERGSGPMSMPMNTCGDCAEVVNKQVCELNPGSFHVLNWRSLRASLLWHSSLWKERRCTTMSLADGRSGKFGREQLYG